jgi:prepilin-type N-terminal cleavage/methylation domain-containing protein
MSHKAGFTLIEILVALLIIGIIASVGIPRLQKRIPPVEQFMPQFNGLLQRAAQQALATGFVYQIMFQFDTTPQNVEISPLAPKEKVEVMDTAEITIPESITIKNISINDLLEPGTKKVWFYVTPQGIFQRVSFSLLEQTSTNTREYAVTLNPFTGKCEWV